MLRSIPSRLPHILALLTTAVVLAGCASSNAYEIDVASDKDVVILLHGLGRSPSAMWRLEERISEGGYQVVNIGYGTVGETPETVLQEISRQIDACCIDRSPQVHFVGHSLGGLLIRAYLSENDVPNLGRVVLIGSPSGGTEVVDNLRGKWWFDWLGPLAASLGTDEESFPKSLERPTYPLGVIAGKTENDNEDVLPGDDDGLVTVASTRVEGMADFIIVESGHSSLRYDQSVADHTIGFLRTGTF